VTAPLISICIPVLNDENHIGAAIKSALAQDYPNLEILVSDNASTDNTGAVIAAYPGISVVRQPGLLSMAANWNSFRDRARGDWVLFLCSDDILKPHALSRCEQMLTPKVDTVFFEYDYLTNQTVDDKTPFYPCSAWIPAPEQHGVFIIGNNFPLTMALVRRETLDAVDWFDESYSFCTDWQLWLKITAAHPDRQIAYLAESLAYYRLHGGNETGRCIRDRSALAEIIRMKACFLERHSTTPERHKEIAQASRRGIARLAQRYADAMLAADEIATADYYQQLFHEFSVDEAKPVWPAGPPWPLPPGSIKLDGAPE
jgi:glycosyltransferase involved in cell wall biosynthesis